MSDPARLWDWAVATYARPGVKPALLALQEQAGVDVVLTLWRIWLWETDRAVTPEAEARAIALSAAWRGTVVAPLRAARNALVKPPQGANPEAADALRRSILETELAAEKLQLEALERLLVGSEAAAPGARGDLRGWLAAFPPLAHAQAAAIDALAAALVS